VFAPNSPRHQPSNANSPSSLFQFTASFHVNLIIKINNREYSHSNIKENPKHPNEIFEHNSRQFPPLQTLTRRRVVHVHATTSPFRWPSRPRANRASSILSKPLIDSTPKTTEQNRATRIESTGITKSEKHAAADDRDDRNSRHSSQSTPTMPRR
jgi:hypothetical protein